jgi:DNA polymerase-4
MEHFYSGTVSDGPGGAAAGQQGSMEQPPAEMALRMEEATRAAERARLRQGIMHVRIRHFYCTLEEMADASLRGQPFVVGTGTGRPNEPGRVIDASPAAMRLGITPGMPLRRAHRLAPRTRFLPASYERYQPTLQRLRERYRAYSRIVESVPIADAFIDLRGCELPFDSPVQLAQRLCAEIAEMGLTALIGIASGKTIAELAALMSRKDGRTGVLYIPAGREASFVQTLPLSMLLQLRASAAVGPPGTATGGEEEQRSRGGEVESGNEPLDSEALAELVAHLRDFGITTFAQVATLSEEGLARRLGRLGSWLHQLARGEDHSLVIPDAPPLSQNARIRFQHAADADETCAAIHKLATYLAERLREQRLKGRVIALLLWPALLHRQTRRLLLDEQGDEPAVSAAEEAIGGQITLARYTDESDIITQHLLMLFAHYHRPPMRYLQVQARIGDIITAIPSYYPPPARTRGKATRRLDLITRKLNGGHP